MKPTQGETYTTIQGDTLQSIAAQAYADPTQYTRIQGVNPMQVIVAADEQLPTGTKLIIPVDSELEALRNEQLKQGLNATRL
ncbi:MAG: LysM peptidoglycan-binding domain-containing protein [Reinekea sp.]